MSCVFFNFFFSFNFSFTKFSPMYLHDLLLCTQIQGLQFLCVERFKVLKIYRTVPVPDIGNFFYLFSAPAPVPAPAPATAIYGHLKLFSNTSTILIEVAMTFSSF